MGHAPFTTRRSAVELDVMHDFIDQVKVAMRSQGINQSRLAELTGINIAGISITLRGGHAPNLVRMVRIAKALGMRLEIALTPARYERPAEQMLA